MKFRYIIAIFFTVCIAVIFSFAGIALMFGKNQDTETIIKKPIKYEITLECEKISSTATNDGWSYKNCLDNLEKAAIGFKIQLN